MNIFAKIIITTDENIKNSIIKRLSLSLKEKATDLEVYTIQTEDENIVLLFNHTKNFDAVLTYAKDNYEVTKVLCVGNSMSLSDVDLLEGDVIVPNTIINEENEAVFFDYIIDTNYDLKKFGLVLNGICFTKTTPFANEEEILELKDNYVAEILDDEAFFLAKELEKREMISLSGIIKIVGKNEEFIENGTDILELML